MNIKASMITAGVISAISGVIFIYKIIAKSENENEDVTFEITGNGAIFFGAFMLIVGLSLIVFGIISS